MSAIGPHQNILAERLAQMGDAPVPERTPPRALPASYAHVAHASNYISQTTRFARTLGIDRPETPAFVSTIAVHGHVRYLSGRRFIFDKYADKALSLVFEVFDEDAETVIDLCAVPLDRPEKFAVLEGHAEGLGMWMVRNPATYFNGHPLHIFRSPIDWIRSGCNGVVIVRPESVAYWLSEALGCIAAEDIAHGRQLARLLHGYFSPSRILAPVPEQRRAA